MKQNKTNPRSVLSSKNQVHRTGLNMKAFTLVELIVVITILAILGTIAFISLQGYSKDTRNSVRLSDLSNINKMLGVKMVTAGKVPLPDNYVEITAGGIVLNYQGEAGERVLQALGVSNGGKDPKDETYYTYSTNSNLTKYQLLGFLEGDAIAGVLLETFAVSDLLERQIKIYGDDVGILLDNVTNIPVTETVDVVTTIETYNITFTDETIIEGTGTTLFSNIYNRNENLLNDKEFAKLDDSLVGYWNMETTTLSGTTTVLKDLSKYGNNGNCYNSGTLVDCGSNTGPQFVDGIKGKAMIFDGENDYIDISNVLLNINQTITIVVLGKQNIEENNTFMIGGFKTNLGRIYLSYQPDEKIMISSGDPSVNQTIGLYKLGEYNNIIYVVNNGDMYGYLDAEKTSPVSVSGTWPEQFLNIGIQYSSNFSSALNGTIDEIRIYNRALSENEIQALYNSTK